MFGNDFFKILTSHKRIQTIVGAAVAYSDSPTYEHFRLNAVEGEIGVYNAATNALITGAIGATTRFFVALKRDGKPFRFTPSVGGEITKQKAAYSAPTKMVGDIAIGTKGTLTVGNIIYTARNAGTDGNSITVTVVDPAGNNAALSVAVVGSAITVNLATDGASAPTSTGAQVLAALQASATASALATFKGTGDMSTVQAAAASAPLTGGANATAPVAGTTYAMTIQDLTPAAQPFPSYMYSVTAAAGETTATLMTKFADKINNTSSVENKERDLIVDAAVSGDLLTLTAKKFGTTFNVLLREELYNVGIFTKVTLPKWGAGYYEQVKAVEEAGWIFAGLATTYPGTNTIPSDWGTPTSFTSAANTYNFYLYTKVPQEASRTPHNVWSPGKTYFLIAVPSNGTNPSASLDTIFGV